MATALAVVEQPAEFTCPDADALAGIAETYMNNQESSGSTADRYQVIVHVNAEEGLDAHIEDGPDVSAVTSRRIACDSSIVTIKGDENGEPLSIGRRSRTIPPAMRRALRVRGWTGAWRWGPCFTNRMTSKFHFTFLFL